MMTWILAHPAEAWFAVTALANVVLRWKTAEGWVEFGEKHPWAAMVIRQVRALGVDPAKAVQAAKTYFETKQKGDP